MQKCRGAFGLVLVAGLAGPLAGVAGATPIATPLAGSFAPFNEVSNVSGRELGTTMLDLRSSPGGNRFVFVATLTGDTSTNRGIFEMTTGSTDITLRVQRGEALPADPGSSRSINLFNGAPQVNDSGQISFACNSTGSGSPTLFIMRDTDGQRDLIASNSEMVPGIPGASFAGANRTEAIFNDGRVLYSFSINEPGVPQNDQSKWVADTLIVRANDNSFTPGRLPDGNPGFTDWGDFTQDRMRPLSQTGDSFVWLGRDNAPVIADRVDIVAVNNEAVVESRRPIPGQTGLGDVTSITGTWADPAGNWFVRGVIGGGETGLDFVVRNGDVAMLRGFPVVPGSDWLWDRQNDTTTISGVNFQIGSPDGEDYFISGWALNQTTQERIEVIVKNGEEIVLRSGDPVDLSGNGQPDNDAFITAFVREIGTGTALIGDDGAIYFLAQVRQGPNDLGRTLLKFGGDDVCVADLNADGVVDADDFFLFLQLFAAADPRADINNDGVIDADDFFAYLTLFAAGC